MELGVSSIPWCSHSGQFTPSRTSEHFTCQTPREGPLSVLLSMTELINQTNASPEVWRLENGDLSFQSSSGSWALTLQLSAPSQLTICWRALRGFLFSVKVTKFEQFSGDRNWNSSPGSAICRFWNMDFSHCFLMLPPPITRCLCRDFNLLY